MRKHVAGMALAGAIALGIYLFLSVPSESAGMAPVTIRLGTLAPSGSSFHTALVEMGQKWRDASGSAVRLIIYPDGVQGGEAAMVRSLRARSLSAGMFTVVGLSQIDRSVSGLSFLPLTFRSWEEYDYVVEKLSPRLEKVLLDRGFVVLFWGDAGPVPLETADILPGLKTNLFNAIALPPNQALLSQCYTIANHMLALKWAILSGGTVIRKDVWDKIPADVQQKLRAAAVEAGAKIRANDRKEDEESIVAMQKKGLVVHPVTPQIEEAWLKLTKTLYPELRGKLVPADIFDEVLRLVDEYRAKTTKK
ncbi:MAG: C4-dicarboxylate transporter substrate-binding protein [Acidobacteria bacterium]|nr:C4-dicarboxylate transporter substrate-binding protein [Acidobacteriota bacterium]